MSTKKTLFKQAALVATALMTMGVLNSCVDEITDESRYTFKGNTVASYLEQYPDTYSSFVYILKKGDRYNLMEAYGSYTCFAPTNDAVAQYITEQYEIYKNPPVDKNGVQRDTIYTGVYSPNLEDLSAEKCKEIAQTHILPVKYKTNEITGVIPTMNLNDRFVSYEVAEGAKKMVNGYAEIQDPDQEVENGVVHGGLTRVLHLSTNTAPVQLEEHDFFSLFTAALKETGIDEYLHDIEDPDYICDYTEGEKYQDNAATTARPLKRQYGYSIFAETDSVFEANGIRTLDDLKERCLKWYPNAKDEAEALYYFVSYHIINQNVMYEELCFVDLVKGDFRSDAKNGYDTKENTSNAVSLSDRVEYYETWTSYEEGKPNVARLLKVTVPRKDGKDVTERVVNFTSRARGKGSEVNHIQVGDVDMGNHVDVHVYSAEEMQAMYGADAFDSEAKNGRIHPISKILVYNEDEMKTNIFYDIMRFDFAALAPELRNSNIRWAKANEAGTPIYNSKIAFDLVDRTMNFFEKSRHVKINNKETMLFYLCPNPAYWQDFQGDEMIATGSYDLSYKIPPLPSGTYEIRVGYNANNLRGIVQFYINDQVSGIPQDLRIYPSNYGWQSDIEAELRTDKGLGIDGKEYAGIINDKNLKNNGYLKGPNTSRANNCITEGQLSGSSFSGTQGFGIMRNTVGSVRKVVATIQLNSDQENWLRMKNMMKNASSVTQGMHDYLEIVPLEYVNDENIPLDEKRK